MAQPPPTPPRSSGHARTAPEQPWMPTGVASGVAPAANQLAPSAATHTAPARTRQSSTAIDRTQRAASPPTPSPRLDCCDRTRPGRRRSRPPATSPRRHDRSFPRPEAEPWRQVTFCDGSFVGSNPPAVFGPGIAASAAISGVFGVGCASSGRHLAAATNKGESHEKRAAG
jgi:hypothetical protein